MNEESLLGLFYDSPFHMNCLKAVRVLDIPLAWIAAGFVRNHVWDCLYRPGAEPSPLNDIDVIYFDPNGGDAAADRQWESRLRELAPEPRWSVKNQARMDVRNNDKPYSSLEDALSCWLETVTPVALRLEEGDYLSLQAAFGLDDLLRGVCYPSPYAQSRPDKMRDYRRRMAEKRWWKMWPGVRVYGLDAGEGR